MTLDQLRGKAENATPGPWERGREDLYLISAPSVNDVILSSRFVRDAEYVASFPPEVALAFVEYVQANEALMHGPIGDEQWIMEARERYEAARARLFSLLGEQP